MLGNQNLLQMDFFENDIGGGLLNDFHGGKGLSRPNDRDRWKVLQISAVKAYKLSYINFNMGG